MDPMTMMAIASTATKMLGGGEGGFGQPLPSPQLGGPRLPEFGGGPKTSLPAMTQLQRTLPEYFVKGSTPQAEPQENFLQSFENFLQSFLGNLDSNLQRPSMGLGLGLLGQASPYLPYAGLLAMGLLDPKKLGGQ
jgi:hypothetical protein